MVKRIALTSVVLFSVISFAALSWAAVTSWPTVTGGWNVTGTVKAKVSVKKGGSASQTVSFSDQFIFDPDASFHMIDMDGTWSQSKLNFSVHLDSLELASYLKTNIEDALWSFGYDVAVTNMSVTKNNFTGKEGKTGATISGKYDLAVNFSIYFYDLGLELTGKATMTGKFAGARGFFVPALGDSQAGESRQSADGMDALLYPLVNSIMSSVLNPNADLPQ